MRKPDWKIWLKDKKECKHWLDYYIKKEILRKSSEDSMLHLKKTNHNLNLANWILEKNKEKFEIFEEETYYDWIINFYYYAIYHAALALMSREGYTSKSHTATLCFLIYHNYHLQKALDKEDVELIATSLSKEDIETIGVSKELREKACYDVHELFEEELANQIREKAVNFVNKIKLLLSE
ncbi:MAG: hypothetical protein PWQ28_778 [Candidatus Woesearchaeota archaeon]|nr:hypothetical protein [Candidatus Woesearchaeota archaeon]